MTTPSSRTLRRYAAYFGIWTALGLLSAAQSALFFASRGGPIPWRAVLVSRLADWYTCGIFTPLIIWLVRRWPIERRHWRRRLPIHLAAAAGMTVVKYTLLWPVIGWLGPALGGRSFGQVLASSFLMENVAFWAVIGVVHAVEFHGRAHEREAQALRLESQLAQARLDALAAQLHPHFLFNTLQGISTLMHRDVPAADQMLARLSDLLRATLQRGTRHEVPLAEELALLAHYVGIVHMRFGDRLAVVTELGPEVAEALVPHFVLQPLVENALQHGIARRAGAGRVTIRAERRDEWLELSVTDDGAGFDGRGFPSEGVGLGNTRARLAQLYGERQRLSLQPLPAGGLRVALAIPYRTGDPV